MELLTWPDEMSLKDIVLPSKYVVLIVLATENIGLDMKYRCNKSWLNGFSPVMSDQVIYSNGYCDQFDKYKMFGPFGHYSQNILFGIEYHFIDESMPLSPQKNSCPSKCRNIFIIQALYLFLIS